jgi:hypothetical protein
MCTTRHGADGGVHDYFSHFADVSQAVAAYTTVVTELECDLRGSPRAFHVRRAARRPRILLVTPEVTELPPGFGNLANLISAKGGGLADISAALKIPTIGIGAGPHCDGQVLVNYDMLGLFEEFQPRFVRRYARLAATVREAVSGFVRDVRSGDFPSSGESF